MLVVGENYACEACVRGHRVSNCQHTDRPLQHINKKSRSSRQPPEARKMERDSPIIYLATSDGSSRELEEYHASAAAVGVGEAESIKTVQSMNFQVATSSPYDRNYPESSAATSSASSTHSSTASLPKRESILNLPGPDYQATPADSGNTKRMQRDSATFHCNLCPKRFARAYNLRSHLRTHADERPFVCAICGKSFARDHDRARHTYLHSGEKRFLCKGESKQSGQWGCGRRFARPDALGRHFRSQAGQICIRPLLEEEALERQKLWQEALRSGIFPMDISGSHTLPAALLAQYPALATLSWSDLSQDDELTGDDTCQRSSFDSLSSESSCDTFSTFSSDEYYSRGSGTVFNNTTYATLLLTDHNTLFDKSKTMITPSANTEGPHSSSYVYAEALTSNDQQELPYMKSEDDLKPRITSMYRHVSANSDELSSSAINVQGRVDTIPREAKSEAPEPHKYAVMGPGKDIEARPIIEAACQLRADDCDRYRSPQLMSSILEDALADRAEDDDSNLDEADISVQGEAGDDQALDPSFQACASKVNPSYQSSPVRNSSIGLSNNAVGKASPYSFQSQESESDSCFEIETELSEDGYTRASSPCSSFLDLTAPKQKFIVQIMRAFWNVYNKNLSSIVSGCITRMTAEANIGPNSNTVGNSRSASSASTSSTTTSLSGSFGKRKGSDDDFPSDDNRRRPKQPKADSTSAPNEKSAFRFACPFRKHNPRKYNVYQHKTCALSPFESVARTKEHLYRRHMAAIQCVRCWLFFRDQAELDIHLSVVNICELRNGHPSEGITPSMEKRLRSRAKAYRDQTEEDRWRDIYRMLFPDEEIPTPYYESLQDDVAQSHESMELPIEEFMRQEVPQIFARRLEADAHNEDFDEAGLLDDQGRLRQAFIARLTTLITEAQGDAISAYRQRSYENTFQSNRLMTPAPSSSSSSFQAQLQEPDGIPIQARNNSRSTSPHRGHSASQEFQSIGLRLCETDLDAIRCCPPPQMERTTDGVFGEASNVLSKSDSLMQPPRFRNNDHFPAQREPNPNEAPTPAIQNEQQHHSPIDNGPQSNWEVDFNWDQFFQETT